VKRPAAFTGLNEISGPIKQGRWVWHHAKGKKSFEANYIENNTHGDALQFFPNGEKQYEATFVGWLDDWQVDGLSQQRRGPGDR
jgi:hypothetical protein